MGSRSETYADKYEVKVEKLDNKALGELLYECEQSLVKSERRCEFGFQFRSEKSAPCLLQPETDSVSTTTDVFEA